MNKVKLKMFYLQLQENKFSSQKLVIVILLYFSLWSRDDKNLRVREKERRERNDFHSTRMDNEMRNFHVCLFSLVVCVVVVIKYE